MSDNELYASTNTSTFLKPALLSKKANELEECLTNPSVSKILAFKYFLFLEFQESEFHL